MPITFDPVGLVEDAYDLDATDEAWLQTIAKHASSSLDRGLGIFAMAFAPGTFASPIATVITHPRVAQLSSILMAQPSEAVQRAFTTTSGVTTIGAMLANLPADRALFERQGRLVNVRDAVGVLAHDGEGGALNLAGYSTRPQRIRRSEAQAWSRVVAHLGAAMRLRRRRHDIESVDAVMSSGGRIQHAGPSLRDDRVRRTELSEGAKHMAFARSRERRRGEQALGAWRCMVAGQWTLVERRESDRRRVIEARRNLPRLSPIANLNPLERSAVELSRRGHGNKQIAYALGVPVGTVSACLSGAMRKVGVRSRVDLIMRCDPALVDAWRSLEGVATAAEIAVASLVLDGLSNAEIAARRGVSSRTVANQLASLFQRLGVQSRSELVVALGKLTTK